MNLSKRSIVLLSPMLIMVVNIVVALVFGDIIGKWAFIPIILIEWGLFLFFIARYKEKDSINQWLKKAEGSWGWNVLAVLIGLIPLGLFIAHWQTLSPWTVWLPWIILALINPWLEEFYWRGLLSDYTSNWPTWGSILFTTAFFSANHAVFGINSELNSGPEIIVSTFIMGLIWAIVYFKTKSLRWCIFSHFLVDFLNLSAAAFLDLFPKTAW
ncbi:MAG: CPBP family intramembrane glutamic endopeptidase [Bacteroidota bacterium]